MVEPNVAKKGPYVVNEGPGDRWWCACGRSKGQPYCDGSHEGSGFAPIQVSIRKAGNVAWCGCKRSARKPHCDGSHGRL